LQSNYGNDFEFFQIKHLPVKGWTKLFKHVVQLSFGRIEIQVVFSALGFTFVSLALDFLSLQLKVPSQVVQFVEKLAKTRARQPEGSFGIQAQLSRVCHPALRHHHAGSAWIDVSWLPS
jgi:hypothetical protein